MSVRFFLFVQCQQGRYYSINHADNTLNSLIDTDSGFTRFSPDQHSDRE
jgi:hypothetical protein